jgi:hypothetical protein
MPVLIKNYALTWNIQTNNGTLALQLTDGRPIQVAIDNAEEFSALGDIMRHYNQVAYDAQSQTIATVFRAVGT